MNASGGGEEAPHRPLVTVVLSLAQVEALEAGEPVPLQLDGTSPTHCELRTDAGPPTRDGALCLRFDPTILPVLRLGAALTPVFDVPDDAEPLPLVLRLRLDPVAVDTTSDLGPVKLSPAVSYQRLALGPPAAPANPDALLWWHRLLAAALGLALLAAAAALLPRWSASAACLGVFGLTALWLAARGHTGR